MSAPSTGSIGRRVQHGMVLVTSMLLLIVVTLLALAMFRSFGLDEKIAGNVREKHRALNAAETAEQYAEWWLANGNAITGGVNCTGLVPAATGQICANPLSGTGNVAAVPLPWTVGVSYTPPPPSAGTAMNAPGGQNTYYSTPTFYITYLGAAPPPIPPGAGYIYQIDAAGYAGSSDTAAIVESTYLVQQKTTCKTC